MNNPIDGLSFVLDCLWLWLGSALAFISYRRYEFVLLWGGLWAWLRDGREHDFSRGPRHVPSPAQSIIDVLRGIPRV